MSQEVLKAIGLDFSYMNADGPKAVLNGIDLEVREGEFLSLLGPSGAGKSTLLRLFAGFERPTAGRILIHGQEVNRPSKERVMIFQGFDQLFSWKSAVENVEFALRCHLGRRTDRQTVREQALHLLQSAGLDPEESRLYPHQLSGGMKQRVAIARAFALKPRVLLLDEPFASLDPDRREDLSELLLSFWATHESAVVFVTHDVHEALILSDRICILEAGSGRIGKSIDNHLSRPRDRHTEGLKSLFLQVRSAYRSSDERR